MPPASKKTYLVDKNGFSLSIGKFWLISFPRNLIFDVNMNAISLLNFQFKHLIHDVLMSFIGPFHGLLCLCPV